jgi:hypothetical protein
MGHHSSFAAGWFKDWLPVVGRECVLIVLGCDAFEALEEVGLERRLKDIT